jgi:hypothetical protein
MQDAIGSTAGNSVAGAVGSSFGAAFEGISAAVADLNSAAGGFAISESGGLALAKALQDAIDKLRETLRHAGGLSQQRPLGMTPAAIVYKPFLSSIADDPVQGFLPAAQQLITQLESARETILKSIDATMSADSGAAQNIASTGQQI